MLPELYSTYMTILVIHDLSPMSEGLHTYSLYYFIDTPKQAPYKWGTLKLICLYIESFCIASETQVCS